ncbi:tetratricopeptide repeat protein [Polyangium sp. y55x31]|uniref:tetratricopeptide repeat protein n=1 Tax=Polyangium sp. y55x31 TaxID=3042688 RepID=UPI00248223EE|nr:tetratricopeptide repeat protein [Polyangium sp. y55x31]MDI1475392.1 tetratricopeptide repeat protein [Polyangium sp. y55x31]
MARSLVVGGVVCASLVFATATAAQVEPGAASTETAAPHGLDFATLVRLGDAARAQGRPDDARKAYLYALKLRPNEPTVLGRLGLLAADAKDWVRAASHLLDAIQGNGGETEAEREKFGRVLARARNEIGLVRVTLNVVGAVVLIDAEPVPGAGGAAFVVYLEPGRHELRAEAPGYVPHVQAFTVTKGGDIALAVEMQRAPVEPEKAPTPAPAAPPRPAPASPPVKPSAVSEPEAPRFLVGVGASAALEYAPGVALGPVGLFEVRWQLRRVGISVGLDARGVRGLGTLEQAPGLSLWSLSAAIPACVHVRLSFFLCGFGQVEAVVASSNAERVDSAFGGGFRVGGEVFRGRIGVRAWGDVLGRASAPYSVRNDLLMWEGLRIGGALNIAGVMSL